MGTLLSPLRLFVFERNVVCRAFLGALTASDAVIIRPKRSGFYKESIKNGFTGSLIKRS